MVCLRLCCLLLYGGWQADGLLTQYVVVCNGAELFGIFDELLDREPSCGWPSNCCALQPTSRPAAVVVCQQRNLCQ